MCHHFCSVLFSYPPTHMNSLTLAGSHSVVRTEISSQGVMWFFCSTWSAKFKMRNADFDTLSFALGKLAFICSCFLVTKAVCVSPVSVVLHPWQ